jgi:hypothetical protein
MLGFGLCLTAATGLPFGLLPARQSSQPGSLAQSRVGTVPSATPGSRWPLAHWLVAVQLALALTVASCPGLRFQSVRRLQQIDVGFDASRVWVIPVQLSRIDSPLGQRRPFLRS